MLWEPNSPKSVISSYKQGIIERAVQSDISDENLSIIIEAVDRVEKNLPSLQTDDEKSMVAKLYSESLLAEKSADAYRKKSEQLREFLRNWIHQLTNKTFLIAEMRKSLEEKDKVILELQKTLSQQQAINLN